MLGEINLTLLHGFLSGPESWARAKGHFERLGYRVHAPKLPTQLDPFEAARGLLPQMPKKNLILVGHSLGGLVAKALLLRHRHQLNIRALVTIATPHKGVNWAEQARKAAEALVKALVSTLKPKGAVPVLTPPSLLPYGNPLELLIDSVKEAAERAIRRVAEVYKPNGPAVRELMKAFEIKVPTLLIGAKLGDTQGDGVVGLWSQLPEEANSYPWVRKVLVSSGHAEAKEHSGALNAIAQFLLGVL